MTTQILAKVAHYYFRDRLTMAQIGERLGMSRHKVGRLLQEAVESGVVKIDIQAPDDSDPELEEQLEKAFGLKSCLVVTVDDKLSAASSKLRTCEVGAGFLRDLIKEDGTIGVGWGSTTFELVSQLETRSLYGAKVVQITGGNKWVNASFDCHEVTRRLAERLGVQPIVLHAPGIVDNKKTRDFLLRESSIAETLKHYDRIDIAIGGIGSLVPTRASALLDSGYVSDDEYESLVQAGAVGDVFSYFVNDAGKVVPSDINERTITIGIDKIHKIPTLVGVASGAIKARAVAAAARSGLINTLIVDSNLARAMLALPEDISADPGKKGPAAGDRDCKRTRTSPAAEARN